MGRTFVRKLQKRTVFCYVWRRTNKIFKLQDLRLTRIRITVYYVSLNIPLIAYGCKTSFQWEAMAARMNQLPVATVRQTWIQRTTAISKSCCSDSPRMPLSFSCYCHWLPMEASTWQRLSMTAHGCQYLPFVIWTVNVWQWHGCG